MTPQIILEDHYIIMDLFPQKPSPIRTTESMHTASLRLEVVVRKLHNFHTLAV